MKDKPTNTPVKIIQILPIGQPPSSKTTLKKRPRSSERLRSVIEGARQAAGRLTQLLRATGRIRMVTETLKKSAQTAQGRPLQSPTNSRSEHDSVSPTVQLSEGRTPTCITAQHNGVVAHSLKPDVAVTERPTSQEASTNPQVAHRVDWRRQWRVWRQYAQTRWEMARLRSQQWASPALERGQARARATASFVGARLAVWGTQIREFVRWTLDRLSEQRARLRSGGIRWDAVRLPLLGGPLHLPALGQGQRVAEELAAMREALDRQRQDLAETKGQLSEIVASLAAQQRLVTELLTRVGALQSLASADFSEPGRYEAEQMKREPPPHSRSPQGADQVSETVLRQAHPTR